jgi:hypothetical protein
LIDRHGVGGEELFWEEVLVSDFEVDGGECPVNFIVFFSNFFYIYI